MFNFRTTTLLFFAILLTLNILGFTGISVSFYWYLLLIAAYLGVSVTASFFIRSGFHLKAICNRKTEHKVIAITFDDGPHPVNTPLLLDILKNRAKATFFCIGKNIPENEAILKRMNDEGHLIGSHSYSHSHWFDLMPAAAMRKEFTKTEELIKGIIGKRPLLFRPPYGVINPMVKNAVKSFPYHVIGFSNRSLDTVTAKPEKTLRKVLQQMQPGDIVLFHDHVGYAPALLEKFLQGVSDLGYIIVGLDELCNIEAYEE
jgi:peptidoglycan/xylan/chitin deacetylase (PgdA/CDA1 family)